MHVTWVHDSPESRRLLSVMNRQITKGTARCHRGTCSKSAAADSLGPAQYHIYTQSAAQGTAVYASLSLGQFDELQQHAFYRQLRKGHTPAIHAMPKGQIVTEEQDFRLCPCLYKISQVQIGYVAKGEF